MSQKKRIFIGIKLSKFLINKISNWRKEHKHSPVNWVHSKDLHITIIPPWYERVENIHGVVKKLEENKKKFTPFTLNFRYIEVIENTKHKKRLIWVRAKANEKVMRLKKDLESILERYKEKRGFKPHITLGKFKNTPHELDKPVHQTGGFAPLSRGETLDWKEYIYHIDLIESKTTSPTKFYNVLKKFSF